MTVHHTTFGPLPTDVGEPIADVLRRRVANLESAIRTHRSQKADDRCIEDDDRLYEVLGDGIKCDRAVGSKLDMLRNCERFIANRCEGGRWPSYAELEAQHDAEKRRRIYYQDIVYAVCIQLDRAFGKLIRKGEGVVCGTADSPSTQVKELVKELADRGIEWAVDQANKQPGNVPTERTQG